MCAESLKKACFLLKFRAMVRTAEWPALREPISHSRKNLAQFSQPRTNLFEGILSNTFNYLFPRSYYDINSTNLNQIVDTKVIPGIFSIPHSCVRVTPLGSVQPGLSNQVSKV